MPAPAPAPPDTAGNVDFTAIHRFSLLYSVMRYDTDAQIHRICDGLFDEFALVDLPKMKNRYMLGTLHGARRQEVWIRGTANFRNALYDLRFMKHRNAKLGINLHAGFEAVTLALYRDILPRLHKDYDLVIFGHSLGGAEAVILAMLLRDDGYKVVQVYASGQPRVTDLEGERKFDTLPVLRIVNEDDPVPLLPPRDIPSADPYTHIGNAVVLLDGPYYCLLGEDRSDEALAGSFWKVLGQEGPIEPVNEHFIKAYLERLATKLSSSTQVPYADRLRYTGVDPAPARH